MRRPCGLPAISHLVAFAALPVFVAWLCTGGLVVHRHWLLPFESSEKGDTRPYLKAEATRGDWCCGVPLVFMYLTDGPPFGLHLSYRTYNVVDDATLKFDHVILELPKATVRDLTTDCQTRMVLRPIKDKERTVNLHSECHVENCLPGPTPFSVRIKGQLRSRGVQVETFDAHIRIPLQYETTIRTGWFWLFPP